MEKKMRMKLIMNFAVVSSSLLLTACAASDMQAMVSQGSVVSTAEVKLSPTKANQVKLYFGNQGLPKHYRIIGHVSADHYSFAAIPHSEASIAAELKKQAASIGGKGVINITTGLDRTTGDVIVVRK